MTPPVVCVMHGQQESASEGLSTLVALERWQVLIDRLVEWGQTPSQVDEDGLQSPTSAAISKSFALIKALREKKAPIPHRLIQDGNGGIVLERQSGKITVRFEVSESGEVEFFSFEDCRLIERQPVDLGV